MAKHFSSWYFYYLHLVGPCCVQFTIYYFFHFHLLPLSLCAIKRWPRFNNFSLPSFFCDFEWIYRNVKEKDLRKHFRSDIGSHILLWFVIAPLCDHFRFLTTLTTIRQHLAFICSCPHFPDHVLPRLHYYAIIPRLILIMVIINDCPPPRVNKATEVRGGKGGWTFHSEQGNILIWSDLRHYPEVMLLSSIYPVYLTLLKLALLTLFANSD